MKETFTLEELKEKYGKEPDLMVVTDSEFLERSRLDDDVADMYAIFFHEKALGGCIVYGKYGYDDKTWSVNPHLRYLVKHLTELVVKKSITESNMANHLTKLITHNGDHIDPEWHATASFETARTICGFAVDEAVEFTAEYKSVKKGGITCEKCLDIIKQIKSIKL